MKEVERVLLILLPFSPEKTLSETGCRFPQRGKGPKRRRSVSPRSTPNPEVVPGDTQKSCLRCHSDSLKKLREAERG